MHDSLFPNTFSWYQPTNSIKWSVYNQSLVRRGEILLGSDVINNWDTKLKEMNQYKVGKPFHYQTLFFFYLAMLKCTFHLPYRQTEEGITQAHAKGKVPSIPIYNNKPKNKSFGYKDKRY